MLKHFDTNNDTELWTASPTSLRVTTLDLTIDLTLLYVTFLPILTLFCWQGLAHGRRLWSEGQRG